MKTIKPLILFSTRLKLGLIKSYYLDIKDKRYKSGYLGIDLINPN